MPQVDRTDARLGCLHTLAGTLRNVLRAMATIVGGLILALGDATYGRNQENRTNETFGT